LPTDGIFLASGMFLNKQKNPPSLRQRYFSLTLLIGAVVVAFVTLIYRDIAQKADEIVEGYEGISHEQAEIKQLRANLLQIYRNIDLFLLDPTYPGLQDKIENLTDESLEILEGMLALNHPHHQSLEANIQNSTAQFHQLQLDSRFLILSRMDVNRQYPGMALSARDMGAPQDAIKSSLSLLIEEIETGGLSPTSREIYPLLLKTYTHWINAISQVRVYLANRFASFSIDILTGQARSLEEIYGLFRKNIEKLEALYAAEDSFEAQSAFQSIRQQADAWHQTFQDVREISESEWWRSDTQIMETRIIPLVDSINADIDNMENVLRSEQKYISEQVRLSNKTLTWLIFVIIVVFLLFIFSILLSMEIMLFKPIKKVTQALISKAVDIELPKLGYAKTREVGRLIDAFIEMDDEVSQRQHALEHQALHDHLTGLPNRFMLNQRLEYQLLSAERQGKSFAMFLMDLDHFKEINDTLGHSAGDALLVGVSSRITDLIRRSDTLARLGGDEFAILLPDVTRESAVEVAKKIIDRVAEPFEIMNHRFNIGVSIGIVYYPDDGNDAMLLLQYADMAMYVAKRKRMGFSLYDPEENIYSKERLSLINDLQTALENDQFELYFQPKIDVSSEQLVGAEALLRWNHPVVGFVPPDRIVELAEHIGIIHKLSAWVLNKGIAQCAAWHKAGYPLTMAINLSVRDLSNGSLCAEVGDLLEEHGLNSRYLTLEITEGVMMENLSVSLQAMKMLSRMGVNLSIDDFGTGFSSLAYLKKLPVDELKIDKSFVIDMEEDENDRVIVQSIINLGHNLELKVVAEGIESRVLMDRVKEFGCDEVQGYFFGRPQTADDFTAMLYS
jgi:diguanylate cyclase (GGDEF)-like protein